MRRMKLVEARTRKGWTIEAAAEQIGCAPNTLDRWELGNMMPSVSSRARLCQVYGLTEEELGLREDVMTYSIARSKEIHSLVSGNLQTRLLDLVFSSQTSWQKLQGALACTVEEFTTMNTGHEAALTRREALHQLAMIPIILGGRGLEQPIE